MDGLWVILLEAFVALCMLLGIVWATWPKGKQEHTRPQVAHPTQGDKVATTADEEAAK
jgi:hypothetical protein